MKLVFVFLLFAVLGTFFAVMGVRAMVEHRRFRRTAVQVPGVITALRAHHSGSSSDTGRSVTYHPVLRFTTLDGRIVETESGYGSNPPPGREGAYVPVLYDPANPADARLTGMWGGGVLLGFALVGLGGLFAVIGLGGLYASLT